MRARTLKPTRESARGAPGEAHGATVRRAVNLGFEIRIELELDGDAATPRYAQLDRATARGLGLSVDDHVLLAPSRAAAAALK